MVSESVWVVVPTINERRNVAALVPHVLRTDPQLHVLVVDDGSTDGTREYLQWEAPREPRLHVLSRRQRGLGSALREGLRYALDHGATRIVTMDADLSHDPDAIPHLLEEQADLVLGSRYVPGGRVVGWPRRRKAISFMANRVSRFALGSQERDLTTGFRAYNRAMARLVIEEGQAEDYNFQVEAVNLAKKHGMAIAEYPITFRERVWGESKLSSRREAAHLVRMLATRSPLRMFLLVGLLGAFVNMLLLALLVSVFDFRLLLAGLVAVEGGILTSFLLNEKWTFRGRLPAGMARRAGRFHAQVFGGLLLNLLLLWGLTEYANLSYVVSNLFGVGTALSWNYWLFGILTRRF